MRYLIVITVLLGIGYSQCNESNWQEYYNSEGHNMEGCDLEGANLYEAHLGGASLYEANLCHLAGSPSGAVCEESVSDNNGDGYDDVSYEAGATSGDLNLDGVDNVLDVVILVDNILNP